MLAELEPGTDVWFRGGPLRLHKEPMFRSGMLADSYAVFGDCGIYVCCLIDRLRMHVVKLRKDEQEVYAICYHDWLSTEPVTEAMRHRNDASHFDHAYAHKRDGRGLVNPDIVGHSGLDFGRAKPVARAGLSHAELDDAVAVDLSALGLGG